MPRRLPAFPRKLAVTVGLFLLSTALVAQPPGSGTQPQPGNTPPVNPKALGAAERKNAEDYEKLAIQLRALAQKWKTSPNPQDRARAAVIERALEEADKKGVKKLFEDIRDGLEGK